MAYRDKDNIVDISTPRRRRKVSKSATNLRSVFIGIFLILAVIIYMVVRICMFLGKEKTSIYEVVAQDLSYDHTFRGICIREESVISSQSSGYINYYVNNGKKAAKNSVVYSLDKSNTSYARNLSEYSDIELTSEDASLIRNYISDHMLASDGYDLSGTKEFEEGLEVISASVINERVLKKLDSKADSPSSSSGSEFCRTPMSGVISYYSDTLVGIGSNDLDDRYFDKAYSCESSYIKAQGLVSAGTPVYRICSNENWSIVAKVTEEFFVDNLEKTSINAYIDDKTDSIKGDIKLFQKGSSYFCEFSLGNYMSEFINKRFVEIEFCHEASKGLKIPVTSIVQRDYYLIPVSLLVDDDSYSGKVLKIEKYDETTGNIYYDVVYQNKYYSDGYYAYFEKDLLLEGDNAVNPETGERVRIGLINNLEGVYNVNKGYYQFVRIERLRQNSEYVIVRVDTPGGLKAYDHIALNGNEALDTAIIY